MKVLLINLGTPDSTGWWDVRKYLNEFLSDRRVIEVNPFLWKIILNLFILTLRPSKTAKAYKEIWMKKEDMSPLRYYTIMQTKKLLDRIKSKDLIIDYAMRYGNPSLEKALLSLKEKNCRKILLLPLFPQYSAVTAATIFDKVSSILSRWQWVPSLHFVSGYHDNSEYINALAKTISTHEFYGKQDKVVFSYHGIPKKYFDEGDPYHCFCQKTSRLVAEALGLEESQYITSFQSRLAAAGREWLKPYTSELMTRLPHEGVKKILILSPGFSMDCLETIEEIDEENKEIFLDSGGEAFHYIACLNDNDEHVEAVNNLITKKISQL